MGNAISKHVKFLRFALQQFKTMSSSYERLLRRINAPASLPVSNPTRPFWMDVPSPISSRFPDSLPDHADVVIIGSGITGASFARTLLGQKTERPLKVVMLEAREACSGATGRNGGHIKPPIHHDYTKLKEKHGIEQAKKLISFRLQHIDELLEVAALEDVVKKSQCREVESLDVYFTSEMFEEGKRNLKEWKTDMPEESVDYLFMEKEDAVKAFHLSSEIVGVVYNRAGAVHPYRLVTSILSRLLKEHDGQFILSTHTPCTSVTPPSRSTPFYTVTTPRGTITTPHVIHATNAYASHLLAPMCGKLFPVRGNMSAQRPGTSLYPSTLAGGRSWVFYDKHVGYDYLTQLPTGENELMFGGGFFQGGGDGLSEFGNTDDGSYNSGVMTHLGGALPILFGENNWGQEAESKTSKHDKWLQGRVKAFWSGIIGLSADGLPWVGRLPPKVSGRSLPPLSSTPCHTAPPAYLYKESIQDMKYHSKIMTAAPGEWIAAGYSGEGMAHAFLSGKALAFMVLGMEEEVKLFDWFPRVMLVDEKRWKKADPEDLLVELGPGQGN